MQRIDVVSFLTFKHKTIIAILILWCRISKVNHPKAYQTGRHLSKHPPKRRMLPLQVPKVGIEPTIPKEHDFESCASAYSATPAKFAPQSIPLPTRRSSRIAWGGLLIRLTQAGCQPAPRK